MATRALWIRRACLALLVIQAIVLCRYFLYGIVKAVWDDARSDCGLSDQGLIPFFILGTHAMSGSMLITWAIMRRAERRNAWFGLLVVLGSWVAIWTTLS